MRNLVLISLLISCLGCSRSPYLHLQKPAVATPCLQNLKPRFTTILYNAQVNVTGKHLSGLLMFKLMNDSSVRVVFTSELGVTFFDFEYQDHRFRVVSIIDQMNKKLVINRLRSDIGLLIMHGIQLNRPEIFVSGNETYHRFVSGKEQVYYVTDTGCSRLTRIETASGKKRKIRVNLTEYHSGMADSVYLAHQSFEYNITLKQIFR